MTHQNQHRSVMEDSRDSLDKESERYRRGYIPDTLQVPARFQCDGTIICGYTQHLSPQEFIVILTVSLRPGTPLALQCSFGQVCYLHLSGRVVSCTPAANGSSDAYIVSIELSAVRDWEHKILCSALKELKVNSPTQEKSLVNLHLSKDELAIEASTISSSGSEVSAKNPGVMDSSTVSQKSVQKPKKLSPRKAAQFTSHPAWVMEMDAYLEPYRQAIWQSKLVQKTSTGQLSLRQVKGWSIQFYPFIESFPQFMATYLAKATDHLSRTFLIDNLRVEKRHADQWIDMAKGFGVPKQDLFDTPILPDVEALTHWLWSITNRGTFEEAVAATNYAIEGVTQGIAAIMVKGFVKYHGKDGVVLDRRAYYWMEAHSNYDDLHPLEALEIIKLHAVSTDRQERVRHAAQRSLEYLLRALDACYWAYALEPTYA